MLHVGVNSTNCLTGFEEFFVFWVGVFIEAVEDLIAECSDDIVSLIGQGFGIERDVDGIMQKDGGNVALLENAIDFLNSDELGRETPETVVEKVLELSLISK